MEIKDLLEGKKPLKFGDQEQIDCIDRYQRAQEEVEEGLRKYRVILHYSGSVSIDVKAHDEEEAKELANEESDCEEIEWDGVEHVEVDLLEEAADAKDED